MNVQNQVVSINFHNQKLTTLEQDGIVYTAIKPICDNIGLHWEAQRQRITRDEVLNSVACMIKATGNDGKFYNMLCLPIDYLNGWLFGVDVKRVKPEIKDTLIMYKKECYKVLHDYWHEGVAVNPRKTTTADRKYLVKAVRFFAKKAKIDYSDAYVLVHQFMNVEHIDEIAKEDLSKAIQYVHGLVLAVATNSQAQEIQSAKTANSTSLQQAVPATLACDVLDNGTFVGQVMADGRMHMRSMNCDEFIATVGLLPELLANVPMNASELLAINQTVNERMRALAYKQPSEQSIPTVATLDVLEVCHG